MDKRISSFKLHSARDKYISIGLDIGSFSIKMVEISHQSAEGTTLLNYAIKELPPEARGREKRTSPLWKKTIQEVIGQCHKTPDYLTLGFSGPSIAVKRMTLPLLPRSEIKTALQWEGKKQFTFPLENAEIFFQERGEKEEEGVKKMDLLVIATLREGLHQETMALDEILPEITGISPVPCALTHAHRKMGKREADGSVALIHLGAEETSISVIKENRLQFSREIYIAGNDLTRVLTEPFTAEGRQFSLSFERAEEIKRQYGIPLRDTQMKTEEGIPFSRIMFIIRPVLERLLTEIIRSFDFYKTQLKEKGIDLIFISGGSSKLKNLKEYVAGGLGIDVELLDPFHEISLALPEQRVPAFLDAKADLTLALGLALEKAQEVNLLPPKPKILETVELQRYAFYLYPILFILLLFSFYHRADRSLRFLQKEMLSIKQELSSIHVPIDKFDALQREKTALEKEFSFLPSPFYQAQYPKALKVIHGLIPPHLCLTRVALEREAAPAGAKVTVPEETGKNLRLEGIVFGTDAERLTTIADLTAALEQCPIFDTVNLISTDEDRGFNQSATDFGLLCSLKPSPLQGEDATK